MHTIHHARSVYRHSLQLTCFRKHRTKKNFSQKENLDLKFEAERTRTKLVMYVYLPDEETRRVRHKCIAATRQNNSLCITQNNFTFTKSKEDNVPPPYTIPGDEVEKMHCSFQQTSMHINIFLIQFPNASNNHSWWAQIYWPYNNFDLIYFSIYSLDPQNDTRTVHAGVYCDNNLHQEGIL